MTALTRKCSRDSCGNRFALTIRAGRNSDKGPESALTFKLVVEPKLVAGARAVPTGMYILS